MSIELDSGGRGLMSKNVRVQLGDDSLPIRIFKDRSWKLLPAEQVQLMDRARAVGLIRVQVFERAYKEDDFGVVGYWECARCGRRITPETGEMHERVPKGSGGEVSLENSEAICRNCHTAGPDAAHAGRRWHTAKLRPEGF